MVDEQCPECGNDIYKPYKYCNACGWEKGEEEEEEEKEGEEEKKTSKSKKGPKKDVEKEKKPLKIKCKCGASITVKSEKRPLKIKCPKCGRSGNLKARKEPAVEKPPKSKKTEKPSPPRRKPERPSEKKFEKKHDLKPKKRPGREKAKGPTGPKRRKHEHARRTTKDSEEEYCPDCGTRLGMTGLCPKCGYRSGPGPGYTPKDSRTGRKKQKPPEGATAVKPKKGVCSKCDSKNLRFYDDGSGRCSDCGREFRWDGGASRLQKDEYECPKCNELLEWIEQYERWYCNNCEEYQ
jgi:predicted RNA-binding Zn-ribbon protein involved in translation (DUF1610 family)